MVRVIQNDILTGVYSPLIPATLIDPSAPGGAGDPLPRHAPGERGKDVT